MEASLLIASLQEQGFMLTATADGLRVTPKSRLTPVIREELTRCKQELLAILTTPTPVVPTVALPAGVLPLWVWDRVHPLPEVTSADPPAGMTELEIAAATAEAFADYEGIVQHWRDCPPASALKARWMPNAPCHRCKMSDWYQEPTGGWRCGRCTPRQDEGSE